MAEYEFIREFVENLAEIANRKNIKKLKVSYKDFKVFIDMVGESSNLSSSVDGDFLNNKKQVEKNQKNFASSNVGKEVVVSPIVGTFYAGPSPEKAPFVKIGDRVKKGDTLFIIESMKLMNEIESEFDGIVEDVLVRSGEGVEYGQPIIILKRDS